MIRFVKKIQSNLFFYLLTASLMVNFVSAYLSAKPSLPENLAANQVVVVANKNAPESVEIARYYMEKRSISKKNLLLVSTSTKETISWDEYLQTLHHPLLDQCFNRGFIEGRPSTEADKNGHQLYAVSRNAIRYLVLCGDIPLKISHDPKRVNQAQAEKLQQAFNQNNAAVDSELALLLFSNTDVLSYLPNPVFKKETMETPKQRGIVKVSRLSGPSTTAVKQMIDSALEAEQHGLRGRVYIDKGGPYKRADAWLEDIERTLQPLGFDIETETSRQVFDATNRFDAPVLYFGWYTAHVTGPFLLPGLRFPPGAIAVHIHSFSAETLSDPYRHWCGPLIARNVAATLGNVYEPYIHLIHRVDLFMAKLVQGWTLGDAAYYALPALSWHSILIGDPLYRPFRVSLDEQISNLKKEPVDANSTYAVMRKMNLLRSTKTPDEVLAFGATYMTQPNTIALRLRLAHDYFNSGKKIDAQNMLKPLSHLYYIKSSDWALVKNAADLLVKNGDRNQALQLYEKLIAVDEMDSTLLMLLLKDGIGIAELSGDWQRATKWRTLLHIKSRKP